MCIRDSVEGALLGGFVGPTWAAKPRYRQVGVVSLVGHDARAAADGRAHAAATALARALVAVPSNIKSPAWLADQAKRVAKAGGATATVWSETALRTDGFGGLLAVGGASATPPRFVRIDYVPKGRPGPVSYTHLDVYKRQEHHTAHARVRRELLEDGEQGGLGRGVQRLSLIHI